MSRELLQQALEALSWIANVNAMDYEYQRKARDSIKALEQELAKPEQEPVRWFQQFGDAPQRKEWVGLTDGEMEEIWNKHGSYETLFKNVETKLKDLNT